MHLSVSTIRAHLDGGKNVDAIANQQHLCCAFNRQNDVQTLHFSLIPCIMMCAIARLISYTYITVHCCIHRIAIIDHYHECGRAMAIGSHAINCTKQMHIVLKFAQSKMLKQKYGYVLHVSQIWNWLDMAKISCNRTSNIYLYLCPHSQPTNTIEETHVVCIGSPSFVRMQMNGPNAADPCATQILLFIWIEKKKGMGEVLWEKNRYNRIACRCFHTLDCATYPHILALSAGRSCVYQNIGQMYTLHCMLTMSLFNMEKEKNL